MGSPYLMAHGLGRPVPDATTTVEFPEPGTYRVWVRTKDWVPDHHPGRFQVIVDGQVLRRVFGESGRAWAWEDGGPVGIASGQVQLALRDVTGFNGRCDAILFTTDGVARPPGSPAMAWRKRLLGLPERPPRAERYDVVVVGGGVAGCSAALTAARLGLHVALVQNRPVLGGNSSTEIGIPPAGLGGPIVDEVVLHEDRTRVMPAEDNVNLYLGWHATGVEMAGNRIAAVVARNTRTNEELAFPAPVFIDCTGDGWVGHWAGADYRMGREGRDEFGEDLAPDRPDGMTHAVTLFFSLSNADGPRVFPDVPWAVEVAGDHVEPKSDHTWEYGHWRDMIAEAEELRDHMLSAIIGSFANLKARYPDAARNAELERVGYIAARGESRRLMGDLILTQGDIQSQRDFPDGVATGSLVFCLHSPREDYDFRNTLKLIPVEPYEIPFRCLYSRNVANLMMAGRDISATHVAYCSTKLQKTGGQMGRAVGAAAFLCRKHSTTPRGIYERHIEELQNIVGQRGAYEGGLAGDAGGW